MLCVSLSFLLGPTTEEKSVVEEFIHDAVGSKKRRQGYLMAEAELKGMLGFSVVSTNDGIQVSSAASNEALLRRGSI